MDSIGLLFFSLVAVACVVDVILILFGVFIGLKNTWLKEMYGLCMDPRFPLPRNELGNT
jgi:hypothetical protein